MHWQEDRFNKNATCGNSAQKKKKKKRHGVEISRWIDIRRRRNDKGYHRDFASENTSPKTKLAKATAAARTVFFSTRQFLTSQKSL